MSKKTEKIMEKVNVEEVKEEIKDEVKKEVKEEIKDEVVIEEVKVNWFNKTKKWFIDHKNEVVAFAAGAATGTGLTAMLIAGHVKDEVDSDDEVIEVDVEEVEVEVEDEE